MGLFIQQNDNRSQLQERLAAELRERAKQQQENGGAEPLDQSKQSNYIKNMETTSDRAWVWFVAVGVLVLGFAVFIITR